VKPSKPSNVNKSMKKTLQKMTAAELVGKLNDCENELKMGVWESPERVAYRKQIKDFMETLTAELDARCEKWRMEVVDRSFVAVDFDHLGRLFRKGKFYFKIPAAELHALLGYLIYMIPKGGAK